MRKAFFGRKQQQEGEACGAPVEGVGHPEAQGWHEMTEGVTQKTLWQHGASGIMTDAPYVPGMTFSVIGAARLELRRLAAALEIRSPEHANGAAAVMFLFPTPGPATVSAVVLDVSCGSAGWLGAAELLADGNLLHRWAGLRLQGERQRHELALPTPVQVDGALCLLLTVVIGAHAAERVERNTIIDSAGIVIPQQKTIQLDDGRVSIFALGMRLTQ